MLEHLLALNALPKIGPVRIRRLLDAFGSAEAILSKRKDTLMQVDGIGPELASILSDWQSHTDPATELRELKDLLRRRCLGAPSPKLVVRSR